MTKIPFVAAAVLAWMCAAPVEAQPLPVAPLPPLPALPPVMIDKDAFKLDHEAFKIDMEHWKADFEASMQHFKDAKIDLHAVDFHAINNDLAYALQNPVPAPQAPKVSVAPRLQLDGRSQIDGLYDQARGFIERDQYSRAVDTLDRIISANGTRADAAMYWKAYSLGKLARNPEALTTLAELQKRYPKSEWLDAARFLEVETRQAAGQPVGAAAESNDEIKLLALQGMMRSDPDTTLPIVEKMLAGDASIRVKERALYVISRSGTARSRDVILGVAKSNANPDLKMAAIRSLGQMSGTESRGALSEIYRSTADVEVKRAALRGLRSANAYDELIAIARSEKDPALRDEVIRFLGGANRADVADALRSIYLSDASIETKRAVIRALRSNNSGAKTLVDLARQEKNLELKTEIVRQLSSMNDPAAREYMLELLK